MLAKSLATLLLLMSLTSNNNANATITTDIVQSEAYTLIPGDGLLFNAPEDGVSTWVIFGGVNKTEKSVTLHIINDRLFGFELKVSNGEMFSPVDGTLFKVLNLQYENGTGLVKIGCIQMGKGSNAVRKTVKQ